jgi:small-conductance mechanosensitive channel
MKRHLPKTFMIGLSLLLGVYLVMPIFQLMVQDTRAAQSDKPAAQMAPAEVDSRLAGMSDEQVRQAYSEKLKQDAAGREESGRGSHEESSWSDISGRFYGAAQAAAAVLKRVGSFFIDEGPGSGRWGIAITKLTDGQGLPYLLATVAGLAVIIALGLIFRWLFLRTTSAIQENLMNAVRLGKLQFLGRVLARMILDALGIGIYILVTFTVFVFFYREGGPNYLVVSVYLIISYYIIVFAFAAKVIFSPSAASLRLFPMEDQDASFLYKWILRIVIIAGLFAGLSNIFRQLGVNPQLYLKMYSSAGIVVILALVIMIWQSRKRVRQAIWKEDADPGSDGHSFRAAFARNWHYFAIIYVLAAGSIWVTKALNEENVSVLNLIISVFMIPIVIGVDQWVQRLLKIASGEARETIDLSGDASPETAEPETTAKLDIAHYVPLIRRFFRIFLVAFIFFGSMRLWGIDISVGRMFTRSALSILVILLLSFIAWQLFKARIDQKLKEEMPDDDEDAEEGGAGGSRIGTLLVLLRKFVMAVMFVIVSLIILSSLGINIGPLIAGAGVLGLAIGFGAQTLVKDIIAGVFFLIDDAFRVGDFIEVGGTKGSVEHISLRSLRLRNPRGPVHTIPFGSMGTVTNNSRDYIISKLDFRVRYDTDVDQVRKIIKRVNTAIESDPEMGPNLLDKVKSQGVRELDDSAMVMRVKFKTIPGEQFVIRREVYRMIQELFHEFGIEFAHRNVTVYMPPEENSAEEKSDTAAKVGAAAAAAVAQAEEEELLKKQKETT